MGLDALLLDTGDLSSPEVGDEVERWAAGWIKDAAALGASRVRVIRRASGAGADRDPRERRPVPPARRAGYRSPGRHGELGGEELTTPDAVLRFLDETQGQVGLLIDLGNWSGRSKYDNLARIAPFAETCHAKCHALPDGSGLDAADYARSLRVLADAGFDGPLALVFEGPGDDPWAGMEAERAIVAEVFAGRLMPGGRGHPAVTLRFVGRAVLQTESHAGGVGSPRDSIRRFAQLKKAAPDRVDDGQVVQARLAQPLHVRRRRTRRGSRSARPTASMRRASARPAGPSMPSSRSRCTSSRRMALVRREAGVHRGAEDAAVRARGRGGRELALGAAEAGFVL